MRMLVLGTGVFAFVGACDSHPREARTPDPPLPFDAPELVELYERPGTHGCYLVDYEVPRPACTMSPRIVKTWGSAPLGPAPDAHCPIRVRVDEHDNVIAEPYASFDPLPREECVEPKFHVGQRRVVRVEDGVIVAYAGAFDGEVTWRDDDGRERQHISSAKWVGFARAPSGTILALGVGRARLGQGGVVALERDAPGHYVPRLIATLPLQPSAVAFDDHGRLVTFAQGFVVRIDEHGRVENLHYVSRELGRINSIARTSDNVLFFGLECGILRLVPRADGSFYEEWWSARDGASGHWSACL